MHPITLTIVGELAEQAECRYMRGAGFRVRVKLPGTADGCLVVADLMYPDSESGGHVGTRRARQLRRGTVVTVRASGCMAKRIDSQQAIYLCGVRAIETEADFAPPLHEPQHKEAA